MGAPVKPKNIRKPSYKAPQELSRHSFGSSFNFRISVLHSPGAPTKIPDGPNKPKIPGKTKNKPTKKTSTGIPTCPPNTHSFVPQIQHFARNVFESPKFEPRSNRYSTQKNKKQK